jgi:hypothetical protein
MGDPRSLEQRDVVGDVDEAGAPAVGGRHGTGELVLAEGRAERNQLTGLNIRPMDCQLRQLVESFAQGRRS